MLYERVGTTLSLTNEYYHPLKALLAAILHIHEILLSSVKWKGTLEFYKNCKRKPRTELIEAHEQHSLDVD